MMISKRRRRSNRLKSQHLQQHPHCPLEACQEVSLLVVSCQGGCQPGLSQLSLLLPLLLHLLLPQLLPLRPLLLLSDLQV